MSVDLALRLASLTRLADAKDKAATEHQLRSYLDLLEDVPTNVLSAACIRLARAETYGFPQVGAIRTMADVIAREMATARLVALPAPERPELPAKPSEYPTSQDEDRTHWYACFECEDTTWLGHWCHGVGRLRNELARDERAHDRLHYPTLTQCNNPRAHRPHGYVDRCFCHQRRIATFGTPGKYGEDMRRPA